MSRSRSKTPTNSDQPRIFVDVRLSDGMDGGGLVRDILQNLGARVYRSWPGARARATHLVWKDGDARTQEEARGCGAKVVGLSWVNACSDFNDGAGGFVPTQAHEIAPAARSTARAFLIQREFATTARKRRQTPRAPDTARLRAEDLPGGDDPRFRSTTSGERTPAVASTAPWSGDSGDAAPRTTGVVGGTPAPEPPRTAIREAWSFTQRDRRSSVAPPTEGVSSGARRSSSGSDIYSQSGTEAVPTQPTQPQQAAAALFSPPAAPAPAPTTRGSRTSAAGGAANLLLSARDRYWDDEPSARRRARGRRATRGSLAPDPTLRLDARLEAASQESSRPRSGATTRLSLASPPAPTARKRRRAVGGRDDAPAPETTPAPPAARPAVRKRRRVIHDDPAEEPPAPRDVIVIDGSPAATANPLRAAEVAEAPVEAPAPAPARRRGAAVAAPPDATTNPLLRAAASPPRAAPAPAAPPRAAEAPLRRAASPRAAATANPMHARDSPTANARTRRRSRGADDEDARPAKRQQSLVISASGVDPAGRKALRAVAAAVDRGGGGKARFADDELLAKLKGVLPVRATHLVAQGAADAPDAKPPRTLKVLFALARGGCAIVRPSWVDASRAAGRWVAVGDHLAGYGPARDAGAGKRILDGLAVHVAPAALGPKDPSSSTLTALVSAAGGRSVALRHAAVALVGADWKPAESRQAGLRALHRSGCALRFRWLCEVVEAGDAGAVERGPYATN